MGVIYTAVPVQIPTLPANRSRDSHAVPIITHIGERCTLHCSHIILHKSKRNVWFKNRNLVLPACLICCSPNPAQKAEVQPLFSLCWINTYSNNCQTAQGFFKWSPTYTQHSYTHYSSCHFLILSVSVTAAPQDTHIEICLSLFIHWEMSSCAAVVSAWWHWHILMTQLPEQSSKSRAVRK